MSYMVALHDNDNGSTGVIWSCVVESLADAHELEDAIVGKDGFDGGTRAVMIVEIPRAVLTLDEAIETMPESFSEDFEEMDEEERAGQAKIDKIVADDVDKLTDTWNNAGQERRTYVQSTAPYGGYQPPAAPSPWGDASMGMGGESDPFEGLTDNEFNDLSDGEFLDILNGRTTVEQWRKQTGN